MIEIKIYFCIPACITCQCFQIKDWHGEKNNNVLPTFYSSNLYNVSETVESLIQQRTTVAGSNIKKYIYYSKTRTRLVFPLGWCFRINVGPSIMTSGNLWTSLSCTEPWARFTERGNPIFVSNKWSGWAERSLLQLVCRSRHMSLDNLNISSDLRKLNYPNSQI